MGLGMRRAPYELVPEWFGNTHLDSPTLLKRTRALVAERKRMEQKRGRRPRVSIRYTCTAIE